MAERRTRAGRKRNLAIRHRQDLEPDRWHDKEIHRHHRFQVIVQERPPRLGRRLAVPEHVLADAGLADVDAELQEFAVNVRRSKEWIFATGHTNQLANLLGHRRAAALPMANLPPPKQAKA